MQILFAILFLLINSAAVADITGSAYVIDGDTIDIGDMRIRLNGIDAMILTKLDVLDRFDRLRVCTGYKYKGKVYEEMPADLDVLENGEPVYTEFKGWNQSTVEAESFDQLPNNARRYIDGLQNMLGAEFFMISIGPERKETIRQGTLF